MNDKEIARKAFTAGYKTRELDVRKDTAIVESVIERKFETWWRGKKTIVDVDNGP